MKSRLCLVSLSLFALSACASTNPYYGELPGSGGDMSVPGDPNPNTDLPFQACVTSEYKVDQPPAAMMIVLDRSSSMAQGNKWADAAIAVRQALDLPVFDSMYLGLYAAPGKSTVAGPQCIFYQPVACAAPPFPVVDLEVAGSSRSTDATGVRRAIRNALQDLSPQDGMGDASPLYAGLQIAANHLKSWPQNGKRILFVVTDGSMSCTSLSNRPAYRDCNRLIDSAGCPDWENPSNIISLLTGYQNDPNAPIQTFVLGAPGADTYDPTGCNQPPYRMRMALSAIAYAGAPSYVPTNCNGRTYAQNASDPSVSCHFDMTAGNFSSQAIASALAQVRGRVVGCAYDLPTPKPGTVLNKSQINVKIRTPNETRDLFRSRNGNTTCADCWDYNAEGRIELYGKTCNDLKAGFPVTVNVLAGCDTIVE
jgi:hypothetical protein